METSDLPKQLLEARVVNPRARGITVTWRDLLDELCLPSIKQLFSTPHNKEAWKHSVKRLLNIRAYITALDQFEKYPLGDCDLPIDQPLHSQMPSPFICPISSSKFYPGNDKTTPPRPGSRPTAIH